MVICLIALGAVWVVLNPAPVVQTAKEPPGKKTLAYHDAMAARDQQIGEKTPPNTDAGNADAPSSVEDLLADDQAATPQDGTEQDLAALPDGAAAEPLPWANRQPGNAAPGVPPQAGYPQQDSYGQPHYPGADPYGRPAQAKPYGQNANDRNAPAQNPYAANVPGSQNTARQNPPEDRYAQGNPQADPYGAQPQPAYPGQEAYNQDPYSQDPYSQDRYGQEAYGDPEAPYGRDPYSQEPYGPGGQVPQAGQNAYPGEPSYPGQDPYGAAPPYPGQNQAALPPGAQPQGAWPQGAQPQAQYPGQAPYGGAPEEWVRVISSGTGMRNTASEEAPILFAFPYGRNLQVVSRNGEWVEVSDPSSSTKGWMLAHTLAPTANPNAYAQRPYFEEPKKERQGPFRNFIKGVFGN